MAEVRVDIGLEVNKPSRCLLLTLFNNRMAADIPRLTGSIVNTTFLSCHKLVIAEMTFVTSCHQTPTLVNTVDLPQL